MVEIGWIILIGFLGYLASLNWLALTGQQQLYLQYQSQALTQFLLSYPSFQLIPALYQQLLALQYRFQQQQQLGFHQTGYKGQYSDSYYDTGHPSYYPNEPEPAESYVYNGGGGGGGENTTHYPQKWSGVQPISSESNLSPNFIYPKNSIPFYGKDLISLISSNKNRITGQLDTNLNSSYRPFNQPLTFGKQITPLPPLQHPPFPMPIDHAHPYGSNYKYNSSRSSKENATKNPNPISALWPTSTVLIPQVAEQEFKDFHFNLTKPLPIPSLPIMYFGKSHSNASSSPILTPMIPQTYLKSTIKNETFNFNSSNLGMLFNINQNSSTTNSPILKSFDWASFTEKFKVPKAHNHLIYKHENTSNELKGEWLLDQNAQITTDRIILTSFVGQQVANENDIVGSLPNLQETSYSNIISPNSSLKVHQSNWVANDSINTRNSTTIRNPLRMHPVLNNNENKYFSPPPPSHFYSKMTLMSGGDGSPNENNEMRAEKSSGYDYRSQLKKTATEEDKMRSKLKPISKYRISVGKIKNKGVTTPSPERSYFHERNANDGSLLKEKNHFQELLKKSRGKAKYGWG